MDGGGCPCQLKRAPGHLVVSTCITTITRQPASGWVGDGLPPHGLSAPWPLASLLLPLPALPTSSMGHAKALPVPMGEHPNGTDSPTTAPPSPFLCRVRRVSRARRPPASPPPPPPSAPLMTDVIIIDQAVSSVQPACLPVAFFSSVGGASYLGPPARCSGRAGGLLSCCCCWRRRTRGQAGGPTRRRKSAGASSWCCCCSVMVVVVVAAAAGPTPCRTAPASPGPGPSPTAPDGRPHQTPPPLPLPHSCCGRRPAALAGRSCPLLLSVWQCRASGRQA